MYLTPLVGLGTPKFRRFILNLIPWKPLHQLRDISDAIHSTAVGIVDSKKRALEDGDEAVARQIGQGNDILGILSREIIPRLWIDPTSDYWLVRANLDASEEDRMTEEEQGKFRKCGDADKL